MTEDPKKTENPEKIIDPAGRLLRIVEKALTMSGGNVQAAMSSLFESADLPDLYGELALAAESAKNIENLLLVSGNPKAASRYKTTLPKLLTFLSPNHFGGNWDQHKAVITRAEVVRLEHCSDELSEFLQEKEIDGKDLDDIRTDVDSLYSQILAANIDERVKKILLDILQKIKQAIHDYNIRGVDGLEEAWRLATSAVPVAKEPTVVPNPEKMSIADKWQQVMTKLNLLVTGAKLAKDSYPLVHDVVEKLYQLHYHLPKLLS
jgi:hypothetical protein